MDYVKRVSDNSVKLCCGGRGCPELKDLGNGMYELTDDNGNKVTLKKEELNLIGDAVKVVSNEEKLILG
ncbi:MAG: hypothetical protein EBU90_19985 [Proteobacteria bacterium]|nr:hypothetical protein [Pseudomonadota bacterium]